MGSATGMAGGIAPLILKINYIMRLAPLNFWSNIYSSWPGERPPPQHKSFRAERMRIDCRKNLNFSLNFSKFLLKFS